MSLDDRRGWIDRRIREGCTNAAALHRELAQTGCRVSRATVRRFVARRLAAAGVRRERANAARPTAPPPPSPRRLSFAWVRRPEDRAADEQARLDTVRGVGAELAAALALADGFAGLIRKRSGGTLGEWLARAAASGCAELRRFAEGVRRDESAVAAALTEGWSNGPTEGHVNRLNIPWTHYPDRHSPSLAGYTAGAAVCGTVETRRLARPSAGGPWSIPMSESRDLQHPPVR
jgi:transposase